MDSWKGRASSVADAVGQLDRRSLVGLVCVLLLAAYVIRTIQVWYRLSHIPGPFLAGFSRFWLLKQSLQRRQADAFKEANDKYGMGLLPATGQTAPSTLLPCTLPDFLVVQRALGTRGTD